MIDIYDYNYDLPEDSIAKFPLEQRDMSKLLCYRNGEICDEQFRNIATLLPHDSLLVFNNTKVVRARIIFFKESGARIEIFCLEPRQPADYERAFAQKGNCQWSCIVGNLKKWKSEPLTIHFDYEGKNSWLSAKYVEKSGEENIIEFSWDTDQTFGQILETLGRTPIPPYLNRESGAIDDTRYQTVYSKFEGSVAAPTAGLHFTPEIIASLGERGITTAEVTLHIGAGTFLPVKSSDARDHTMHIEHFEISVDALRQIYNKIDNIVAVGTTSVRTLESLAVLGYRALTTGDAQLQTAVGQWEAYNIPTEIGGEMLIKSLIEYAERNSLKSIKSSTQIMITPSGFKFRVIRGLVTNFHQPKSTLLLLIAAIVGENWQNIYRHALQNEYRFLSYGDSSYLIL